MILFHHRAEIGCGRRVRTINCAFKERRVACYSIPQRIGGAGGSCNLTKPDYLRRAFKSGAGLLWLQLPKIVCREGAQRAQN